MIVMDTCAIIWDALAPDQLTSKAKQMINMANEDDGILFCEISLWEIAMLIHKKRIDPNSTYQQFIQLIMASNSYSLVGLNPKIAELATTLPSPLNHDPADRIITATAVYYNAKIVTADKNIRKLPMLEAVW